MQAASVPVVYSTAYYALIVRANLRPGESVLIHSGSGGVGQAAISICLKMGCEVFTTVGTKEKREYLMATFPDLKPENIGNSRDLSFEQMVMCLSLVSLATRSIPSLGFLVLVFCKFHFLRNLTH